METIEMPTDLNQVECTYCGYDFDLAHGERPESSATDERIHPDEALCSQCYSEHYEFQCCWCQDFHRTDEQHEVLVVTEAVSGLSGKVNPGVYRIAEKPYYADGLIDGYVFNDALDRVADVPADVDTGYYPAGHLCRDCRSKLAQTP